MLYRKIENQISSYITANNKSILLVQGARQVGKTFIIRQACKKNFKHFVEINLVEDAVKNRYFADISSVADFYLQLGMQHGANLGNRQDTIVFIDEIQQYPQMLTLLKFLADDARYTYVCSGSLLGVALSLTTSVPIGSIHKIEMQPLDFEEFAIANGMNEEALDVLRNNFTNKITPNPSVHSKMMDLFKKYLLVGGMPAAVDEFIHTQNMTKVRQIQSEIYEYYRLDASKYDRENKLVIQRVFDAVPSAMQNIKKRIVLNKIEGKNWASYRDYANEFDYLINAGIVNAVSAIANPVFPLLQSQKKNLLKLYLNDVGILNALLFRSNITAILNDVASVNLGAVYETVVASELAAHGHKLYYYDNRKNGEVDFLIDHDADLSVLPIEVKSGRDFYVHSSLNTLVKNDAYASKFGIVLNNNGEFFEKNNIIYMPIYFVMFL